ncbi:MAG: hypothetical protein C5B53_11250 [Candidatus Melainabacteria bacterium]|nr:MAG: hypothetical protein C5B53_11250 [Candidatus Melainabacteria bacterium]
MTERGKTIPANEFQTSEFGRKRAALVVGHPGHELRVFGWLSLAHPIVAVLTDGSGSDKTSRLHSTSEIIRNVGAKQAAIFGKFTDREMYAHLLDDGRDIFLSLVEELTNMFLENEIDYVASDAYEEFNPTHDLCNYLVKAAVALASERRVIEAYAFSLDAKPSTGDAFPDSMIIGLDDELFARKIAAARQYHELAPDIAQTIDQFGSQSFKLEVLFNAKRGRQPDVQEGGVPYYEKYGEEKVRSGLYSKTIRLKENMMPIFRSLSSSGEE